ncbi:MAG: DUF2946 family protein [Rhodoferax sp.]|nr:DUF2946 family protein [Rhodoferax sp.]
MDDIVKQAMSKWPNVPHCYGWLGLDARGNWYMRDDRAQAQGTFASGITGAKGSRLHHAKLIDFIQRNYAYDDSGQWYFQNGPQRVYVELEATPWVWRISANGDGSDGSERPLIANQAGQPCQWHRSLVDEQGWLYCETDRGFGLVHTLDMNAAADAIERGAWQVEDVLRTSLPQRYGYITSPQQQQQATKKPVQ